MGFSTTYKKCDCCGKIDPEIFPGTRLTKCCSTTRLSTGEWEDESKAFYTVDENTSSIGKMQTIVIEELPYDSDWNLLMEVIEKLEGMKYEIIITTFGIYINHPIKPEINVYKITTKIQMVYDAVCEAILSMK